jgi:hypothetical protein
MSLSTESVSTITLQPGTEAPRKLRSAIQSGDHDTVQRLMLKHFRKPRRWLEKQCRKTPFLCMWSVDDSDLNGRERELAFAVEQLQCNAKTRRKQSAVREHDFRARLSSLTTAWLEDGNGTYGQWELIAIGELLLCHGQRIPSRIFTSIVSVLAKQVLACQQSLQQTSLPMLSAMLNSEAGLLLCHLLQPLRLNEVTVDDFTRTIQTGWDEVVDEEGVLHASVLNSGPAWLSTMVRCQLWSAAFGQTLLDTAQHKQWTRCVRRSIAMLTADGQFLPETSVSQTATDRTLRVMEAAAGLSRLSTSGRYHQLLKDCNRWQKAKRPIPLPSSVMPEKPPKKSRIPSWQSDESCVAIMRTSRKPFADLLTASWQDAGLNLALSVAGAPFLKGNWKWNAVVDGTALDAPSSWRASCWYLDPDVALVELTGATDSEITVLRHIVLSMTHQFAIVTDTLTTGNPNSELELTTSLETVTTVSSAGDAITPELLLTPCKRRQVRVIPAWLEDDRIRGSNGTFTCEDGICRMSATGKGGLVAPMVFDWNDKRGNALADWNRVTVCESGHVVTADQAGAFRVRAGKLQLMIYRSMKRPDFPRSILGMHTSDETIYARVVSGDPPRSIVEIESAKQVEEQRSVVDDNSG